MADVGSLLKDTKSPLGGSRSSVTGGINTVYDAKLKSSQVADAVANSPVYGKTLHAGGAIFIFVGLIFVVFFLIVALKK